MRVVLLAFDDNDMADAFVKAIDSDNVLVGTPASNQDPTSSYLELQWDNLEKVRVEAMWAVPTQLCTCHPPYHRPNPLNKGKGTGLNCHSGRSKKYGWLLCTLCMKPHGFQTLHPKDLLGETEVLTDRKFVLGFRADKAAE